MEKSKIKHVQDEAGKCCGCGLCYVECPVHAIKMQEDDLGYVYPVIDEKICINCNKCVRDCVFNNQHQYKAPLVTYAGVRNNKEKLRKSSSGGIFAAIAEAIIKESGDVCGAEITSDFSVKHKIVKDEQNLVPLLGSKYVQSDISAVFKSIKSEISTGRLILFCGTPCQVDAIKFYTGNPKNLFTIEVICHGVPNQSMFKSYVNMISKKYNKKIKEFQFRDKKQGWSYNHRITFSDDSVCKINHRLSSYMTFFMQGCIYRESCYQCPYAQNNRNADITVGDFWGIIQKRPDLGKKINIDEGVSCVIVNSKKGEKILKCSDLNLWEVNYLDIIDGNGPLKYPSKKGKDIMDILNLWKKRKKWFDLEDYWRTHYYKLRFSIWAMLPNQIRNIIRIILKVR